MRKIIAVIAVLVAGLGITHAQDVAGDWQGTLKVGTAELHLVLHVMRTPEGQLKGALDSVDQGARGIPVSSLLLKDSILSMEVAAVRGTYTGKLNQDATEIDGTWSQGQPLPLKFTRTRDAVPSDFEGVWLGTLNTGADKLRMVFHIAKNQSGLSAMMDSPDQGGYGKPATSVSYKGPTLTIEVRDIGGKFEGALDADHNTIHGGWTQNGTNFPISLKRVKDQDELKHPLAAPRRPQNPVKPYPYREEEVAYENHSQNVRLAATLTIPQGKGPFPAVLLITGSGPQDRDETGFGHKPFLVVADYLTRRGIAVLRADDRGVGKSTGNSATATSADFATDVEAGLEYLKTRPEIDSHRMGLIGHSEGGMIAPMVASRNQSVAFIVMLAGPGVSGKDIVPEQVRLIAEAGGVSHQRAQEMAVQRRAVFNLVTSDRDETVLSQELSAKLATYVPEAQIGARVKELTSPWYRYFVSYDPAEALQKVRCPVLALNGGKDLQVSPKQNLPAIRKALEAAGNTHFEVEELPGLNHLFQTATTGAPTEYAEIEETMSPVVLERIASWIAKR